MLLRCQSTQLLLWLQPMPRTRAPRRGARHAGLLQALSWWYSLNSALLAQMGSCDRVAALTCGLVRAGSAPGAGRPGPAGACVSHPHPLPAA